MFLLGEFGEVNYKGCVIDADIPVQTKAISLMVSRQTDENTVYTNAIEMSS